MQNFSFLWTFFMASAAAVLPSCLGLPGQILAFALLADWAHG
jgi:hypothetical protein